MSSRNSRKSKRRKYDTFLCSPGQLKAKKKYFRAAIIEAIRRDSRLQATLSHKVFDFFLWLLDTLYPCHSTVCTVHRLLTIVLGQTMEKNPPINTERSSLIHTNGGLRKRTESSIVIISAFFPSLLPCPSALGNHIRFTCIRSTGREGDRTLMKNRKGA